MITTELSKQSGVNTDDLVSTMQRLGIIKYCKGQHIVLHDKVCGLYYGSVCGLFSGIGAAR